VNAVCKVCTLPPAKTPLHTTVSQLPLHNLKTSLSTTHIVSIFAISFSVFQADFSKRLSHKIL